MYKVMDWIANKDMVSLAGLNNTNVAGKEEMVGTAQLAETVMSALGKDMPPELRERVTEMRKEMEECKTVLRQHLEDSMHPSSFLSSHCLNHSLNPTEGYSCAHNHPESETCGKPFRKKRMTGKQKKKKRGKESMTCPSKIQCCSWAT